MTLVLSRRSPDPAVASSDSRRRAREKLPIDGRYRFWLSYMRLGFGAMTAVSVVDIVYAALAVSRPHPAVVVLVSTFDTVFGVVGLALTPLLARWRYRAEFVLASAVVVAMFTAAAAYADGGLDSPLLFIVLLPVIFAGAGLRPWPVAAISGLALAELTLIGATDHDTADAGWRLVVFSAFALGVGAIEVSTAFQRRRLQDRELQLSADLRRSAEVDDLTDAMAYHPFQDRMASEISAAIDTRRPLTLIACDLDDLRSYNAVYGEVAGDAALKAVAQVLVDVAGGSDVIGRTGGDELQMLCPNTSLLDAAAMARRAHQRWTSEPHAVALSVGVAQLDWFQPTVIRLLRDVDIALVEAKSRGGNTVVLRNEVPTAIQPAADDDADPGIHKRLNAAVRHARRQTDEMRGVMSALVGGAPAGFAFVGRDAKLRLANPTMIAATGCVDHDPIGKPLVELMPQLWPSLHAAFDDVIRTGEEVTGLEFADVRGTGATTAWLTNLYPVRTDQDVIGVGVIAVDITDRKRLERAGHDLTEAVVRALAATAEARDPYTAGHQSRVADLAVAIASRMNLADDDLNGIRMAATIHDIGKVAVPAELLARPGRLQPAEFALIKTHAQAGYDILRDIPFPWPVADMVRQHHERLDGSGYPQALRGTEILLGARIIAVADVVEAMAADRPYRPRLGIDAAIAEIAAARGIRYDGDAVDACLSIHETHDIQSLLNVSTMLPTP